jgi:hypothetical protein
VSFREAQFAIFPQKCASPLYFFCDYDVNIGNSNSLYTGLFGSGISGMCKKKLYKNEIWFIIMFYQKLIKREYNGKN